MRIMAKFKCRGTHKVFGKYRWKDVTAKNSKKAKEKFWRKQYGPGRLTTKTYKGIVCKKK
jgi:hypothetical protein